MNTNAGYTLIEILVVLGVLSITSGIAYVSYTGYIVSVSKKDLYTHGLLFASAVQNCITVRGGWEIKTLNSDGDITGTDKPCDTHVGKDKFAEETTKLKKKLNFICPADATCETHTHTYPQNRSRLKYTCLSIEKEVSGKKLQVISRASYENPSNYEIWCNEVSTSLELKNGTCRAGAPLSINALIEGCPGWR